MKCPGSVFSIVIILNPSKEHLLGLLNGVLSTSNVPRCSLWVLHGLLLKQPAFINPLSTLFEVVIWHTNCVYRGLCSSLKKCSIYFSKSKWTLACTSTTIKAFQKPLLLSLRLFNRVFADSKLASRERGKLCFRATRCRTEEGRAVGT